MTALTHELKASYAFVERNFFLTRRYWGWELAFLVYSVAGALSISLIGAEQGSPADPLPDDRRDLLELPVGGLQLDRRDDRRRALGGHARVHDDGADPALDRSCSGRSLYAIVYGLVHTAAILVVLVLFFPQLDLSSANLGRPRRLHGCSARSASSGSA